MPHICKKLYTCDKCINKSCDWCEIEQTMCPKCDSTLKIHTQNVCIGCLYFNIIDCFSDVFFCCSCDEYLGDVVEDREECVNNKHIVINDKKKIIEYIIKKYSKAKKFFKLFYGVT